MKIHTIRNERDIPDWTSRDEIAQFLHHNLKPYNDEIEDVQRGLDYAFSSEDGMGGFVVLGEDEKELVAVLTMLRTGMKGYIPENLLLFVGVLPDRRGQGLGRTIIDVALAQCDGDVKLHVEHENPAKRLYERIGFTEKYAEMRLKR